MDLGVIGMAVLGLAVCCMGFVRRPRNSLELISSRFVVPAMIGTGTFLQVFWHYSQDGPDLSIFARCRADAGFDAVIFIVLCLICFWIGYALPIGRRLTGRLLPLAVPMNPWSGTAAAARAMCCAALVLFILFSIAPEEMVVIPGIKILTMVVTFVAAAFLGVSFPDKSERNVTAFPVLILWLAILSLPLMGTFSRGVGVPVLVAAAAFSVRRGRMNWLGVGVAAVWSIIGIQIAFSGRGVLGHYAGVLAWLQYAVTGSFWSGAHDAIASAMSANDSFTSLCVSMRAVATTDIFALTPVNWLIFQIPMPHIFSWSPVFTLSLPQFLGGAGSWNYTPGIFGDVFIHLGWAGSLMFLFVGCAYRGIDELALAPVPVGTINPFVLLLVFGYAAMGLGMFNNFRSWNTALVDGTCFVVAILFLRKVLVPADAPYLSPPQDSAAQFGPYGTDW